MGLSGTSAFEIPPGTISIVRSTTTQDLGGLGGYTVPAGRKLVLLGWSVGLTSTGVASIASLVIVPLFDTAPSRILAEVNVGIGTLNTRQLDGAGVVPVSAIVTVLTGGTAQFTIWGYETTLTGPGTQTNAFRLPVGAVPIVRATTVTASPFYTVAAGRKLVVLNWWGTVHTAGISEFINLSTNGVLYDPTTSATLLDGSPLIAERHYTTTQTGVLEIGDPTVAISLTAALSSTNNGFVGFNGYEVALPVG